MKSLYYDKNGIQLIDHTPKPAPGKDEALIRVRMAGICRTDLEITRGYSGFEGILGHEFVGELENSIDSFAAGTRVVGEINAGCGHCEYCRKDLERHCLHRTVLGIVNRSGCMAEWFTLPARNLYPVPDSVSDEQAVFTEPLAAALEIFEQILIRPADKVCILGDGKLGLIIAMLAAHRHEGETLLIGRHGDKLAIVKDRTAVMLEEDIPGSYNKSWDVVIDATGKSAGLSRAMNLVRPRGVIVLKSTMAESEPLDLTPIVVDEINLIGSRCGRFAPALDLLSRGVLPIGRLIDSIHPMEKALEAWERALRPGARKVLIRFTGNRPVE
ncbi:MAG: alcohol dehydrogenase catalytic domain-containing protein [Candidatus Omnitrophica bacterium]|nr:alcohol dehydrogenase catalytic domain-containing protein [Candidatus Omnitrophota bacterium]